MIEDLAGLIERGGIVMIPLIALSVVALGLVIERTWFWLSTNSISRVRRLSKILPLLAHGDAKAKQAMLRDNSAYGRIYREIVNVRRGAIDAASLSAVESERPRLERFLTTLSTIITAAPLLGILGTVLGIIQSFEILSADQELKDPTAVSAGIAEALLTTAAGLLIALLALFPYTIFRSQVDRTLGRIEGLVAAVSAAAGETEGGETPKTERSGDA